MKIRLQLISYLQCGSVEQVDLCFYLIRGFLGSLEEMVIVGAKRRMEELSGKHMKGSRLLFHTFKSLARISLFIYSCDCHLACGRSSFGNFFKI
jgi:hypothetical protein